MEMKKLKNQKSKHPSIHPFVPQKMPLSLALRGGVCSGSILGTTQTWITLEVSRASSCLSVCCREGEHSPTKGFSVAFQQQLGAEQSLCWKYSEQQNEQFLVGEFCLRAWGSFTERNAHHSPASASWLQFIPTEASWGDIPRAGSGLLIYRKS